DALVKGDPGARDGRGACAAIGLQHVAIDADLTLAERLQVHHRTKRTADKALDFLRAAGLLAGARLAAHALMGRARQHAVFGGDPALPAALEPRRHPLFKARRAEDMGIAEAHEAGAFGVLGDAGFEADGAHFMRLTSGRAHISESSAV